MHWSLHSSAPPKPAGQLHALRGAYSIGQHWTLAEKIIHCRSGRSVQSEMFNFGFLARWIAPAGALTVHASKVKSPLLWMLRGAVCHCGGQCRTIPVVIPGNCMNSCSYTVNLWASLSSRIYSVKVFQQVYRLIKPLASENVIAPFLNTLIYFCVGCTNSSPMPILLQLTSLEHLGSADVWQVERNCCNCHRLLAEILRTFRVHPWKIGLSVCKKIQTDWTKVCISLTMQHFQDLPAQSIYLKTKSIYFLMFQIRLTGMGVAVDSGRNLSRRQFRTCVFMPSLGRNNYEKFYALDKMGVACVH